VLVALRAVSRDAKRALLAALAISLAAVAGCGGAARTYYDDLEGGDATASGDGSGFAEGGGTPESGTPDAVGSSGDDAGTDGQEDAVGVSGDGATADVEQEASGGDAAGADGAPDASDGSAPGSPDAGEETGTGCGPLNTTTNCSACGLACDTATSAGARCDGGTCSYSACDPGYKDCTLTAPDTDGCETRVNTTLNCGGCGVVCGTLNVATPGCSGTACTYTCNTGYSNCNQTGSNTTGCECHTTSCCGTPPNGTCETVHSNGVGLASIGLGQTWDDCVALDTYNETQALAACYAKFGSAGSCQNAWTCGGSGTGYPLVTQSIVCDGACTQCWAYGTLGGNFPTTAGTVTACTCPHAVDSLGNWN
jgi:hypothetical protein